MKIWLDKNIWNIILDYKQEMEEYEKIEEINKERKKRLRVMLIKNYYNFKKFF